MAAPFTGTVWTITDAAGNPVSGAKVRTYEAGTLTDKAVYTSASLATPASNPVIADSSGRVQFFMGSGAYRFKVFDSSDVELTAYAADNVYSDFSDLFDRLALGTGADLIGWQDTSSVVRTVADTLDILATNVVSVKDARFGAVGDWNTDDTAAIQAAINFAVASGAMVWFPSGTYRVTPGTAQAGAASYNTALVMHSGMHIAGERGAVIKISDNYSTDASPKELAIFSTVAHIGDVSFDGITFDLNGVNNKISPSRPTTYAQFNHSAILVNGPTGYVDDVVIKNCTFQNTAGVCFIVAQLVAAGTTPPLGHRWKIINNLFLNGGSDSNDHTSIYAWAEDVLCEGNTFWEDSPPRTVGKTGGATCYEIHGSNQRFVNNYCYNYTLGAYVAPNFTNTTLNSVVQGNHFYCSDYGILLWRGVAIGYLSVDGVLIQGNSFYFDNWTYTGQPAYKAAIAYQGQIATVQGAINNVKISGNYAINVGTSLLSQFVRWDTSTTASNTGSNLSITDNQVIGFTDGVYLVTNSANGMGLTEISRNQFINGTPDSLANPPHGIYVLTDPAGPIKTLVITDNQFIDERNTPLMDTAIYFAGGTITDLALGPQVFKGMTTANCYNAGPATITRQIGIATTEGSSTVADGGTITFNADYVGFTPKAIKVTGSVAGEIVSVTAVGANTFTVAIKKWTGGALTAGTSQTVYWSVRF